MTQLYLLAFDHRTAFTERIPAARSHEAVVDAKRVIWNGFLQAVDGGVPREAAGILIDEEYGAPIARQAKEQGVVLAMPVEAAGTAEFEFQHGDDFGLYLERWQPDYAKVLVRYDARGDKDLNARQRGRLKILSDWLRANDGKFMLEVVVPGEGNRLELMLAGIDELQQAGIAPAIWKVDGLASLASCREIVELTGAAPGGEVGVVVLGRNAPADEVASWLRAAAATPGLRRLCGRPDDLGRGARELHRGHAFGRNSVEADRRELPAPGRHLRRLIAAVSRRASAPARARPGAPPGRPRRSGSRAPRRA